MDTQEHDPLAALEVGMDDYADALADLRERHREVLDSTCEPPMIRVLLPSYESVRALYFAKEIVALHYPEHECLEDLRTLYRELAGTDAKVSEAKYREYWPSVSTRSEADGGD